MEPSTVTTAGTGAKSTVLEAVGAMTPVLLEDAAKEDAAGWAVDTETASISVQT